jgi:DEAD/DEAH box helicase domain-containing protein
VLLGHVRAATFELPFEPGAELAGVPTDELLEFLAEEAHVRHADDGRWYWASENFPASEISLRVAAPENVVIIDTAGARPRVIGEVDLFNARTLVHENAIYLHESRQYHVDRLDWDERRAYVRPIDVDHYTQAELSVTLKPLERFAVAPAEAAERAHGEVMVSSIATIYKKLRLETHENLGWGRIYLPEIELHTTAYWLALEPNRFAAWRRDELDAALAGAGRALQTVGSVLLMADPHDLGLVAQVRSPHVERPVVYLYDAVPGGVGLAARLFARHDELIAGALALVTDCACATGCPACVGPRLDGDGDPKRHALRLLHALAGSDEVTREVARVA